MTNLEASKHLIAAKYPFSEEAFKAGLTVVGLDPDAEVVPGQLFDVAVAQLIPYLITSADISEGGYAVKLDRESMLRVRKALLDKWDSPVASGPTLRDRTNYW